MPVNIKKKKKTKISKEQLAELEMFLIEDKSRSNTQETNVYRANQAKWLKQIDGKLQKELPKESWESNISLPYTYTECETVSTRIYQALSENDIAVFKPTGEEDIEMTKKKEAWFNWYLRNYIRGFDETLDRIVSTTTRLGMSILYSYYDRTVKRIMHKRTFEKIEQEAFIDEIGFDIKCQQIITDIYGNDLVPENAISSVGEFIYKVKYLRSTPIASIKDEVEDEAIMDFYPREAEGKIEVEVEESNIDYDGVRFQQLSLDNVWFPSTVKSNDDLQECEYHILEFETNYSDIFSKQRDGVFDLLTTDDVELFKEVKTKGNDENGKPAKRETQQTAGISETLETDKSKNIRYYEYYKRYDINNDGIAEDIVMTYFPDYKKTARVKWLNQIFRSGTRPIDIINYSVREGTIYAYGIPEIIHQVAKEIDVLHNQFINNNTLSNTPFGGIRNQSNFNNTLERKDIKLKAGALIPLDDVNDIKFYSNPSNHNWNLTDVSLLMSQGQDAVGTNDAMRGKEQHSRTPVGSTLKLIAEANIRIKQSLIRGNRGLKAHLKKIYQLARDYGPAKQMFRVMGENGDFHFPTITREDLKNMPDFELGTSLDNLNKVYMREVWILLFQQMLNPFLIQSGLVQNMNIYEMLKKVFESYDIKDYQKLITKPMANPLISQQEELAHMIQGEQMEVNQLDNHKVHQAEIEAFKTDDMKMGSFPPEYIYLLSAHEQAHTMAIQQQELAMQLMQQQTEQGQGAPPQPNIQRPKAQPMQPPGGQPQGMMPQTGG